MKFYKDRVSLNVLTQSLDNAKELYEITEGNVVLGLLSADYDSVDSAVEDMTKYEAVINNAISVGLGAGDPSNATKVSDIAKNLTPDHINQVFTHVGSTRAKVNNDTTFINSLISPSGKPGYVIISTGQYSSKEEDAVVSVRTAIAMIQEMGGNSLKFYPMRGLETIDEYIELCKAAAEMDFAVEPTGGIDLDNFEEIVRIPLELGVKKVVPHVYTSVIDKETGLTKAEDVKTLYATIKKLVDNL